MHSFPKFVLALFLACAAAFGAEPPANFVVNPGFESNLTPWIARASATLLVSTQAQAGTGSAWITNRTAAAHGIGQSLLGRIQPGGSYFCAAWVRAESATSQVLRISFEQRDVAGTNFFNVASTTVTNNAWTFLSGVFSLKVTGALQDIIVYVDGPASGVDLRVDNVAVVPLAGYRLAGAQRNVMLGGVGGSPIYNELPFGRVAATDFHIAGSENALKFASLHPNSNSYSFGTADSILNHGEAHGQLGRGHTLLWHGSVPTWVASNTWTTSQLQTIAFDHVDTVVSRYRDRLFCWDVVNEAFNDNGTVRSTIWYDTPGIGFAGQGTKYIEEAFKRARAAAPNCRLIYNDYSTETVNAKSDAIYAMAQDFKARGVPIDGIGFQFHIGGTPSLSSMRSNFQRFNDLGLDLHITELDVSVVVDSNGLATAAALAAQGDTYFNVAGTALAFPRLRVFQTWGFTDRYSWIPGFSPGRGAALTLDANNDRKPATWALYNVLANQAETLPVLAASSGDSSILVSNTSFSAGAARQFQANAVNDFITLGANVLYTGEYNVRVGVRKSSSAGQFQLAITRAPGGAFVNLGSSQDTYASATSYNELNLGSFTFTNTGTNSFRFTVTGKNASSSDYDLTLDYLRLTPTGADGNQPPAVSAIPDQMVNEGSSAGPLPLTVSDRETTESGLAITFSSSNPALLPTNNLSLTGGGQQRLLVATPVANKSGAATITVTVTDASGASTSNSFVVGVVPLSSTLVSTGAVWKYWAITNFPGAAWRSNNYNDASWLSGPAQLGFGDGDEATVVASNKQVTTYFRRAFNVADPGSFTNLSVRLLRDDGAVVYLNGVEVFRSNMPTGPILQSTVASSSVPAADETTTFYSTNVDVALLLPGVNVLAVEVHQVNTTSTDLSFDLDLVGRVRGAPPSFDATTWAGNHLRLTWPDWATAYALYFTTNLVPPFWLPATNIPVLSNQSWSVELTPSSNETRFYRLQAP